MNQENKVDDINEFLGNFSPNAPAYGQKLPVESFLDDYINQLQWTASGQLTETPQNINSVQEINQQQLNQAPNTNYNIILDQNEKIVQEGDNRKLLQQREVNRKAQQRFRQRSRARQEALKATFMQLQEEMDELKQISIKNDQTQEKLSSLEDRIKNIEQEIMLIKEQTQKMSEEKEGSESYNFNAKEQVQAMYISLCQLRIYLRSLKIDKIGAQHTNIDETVCQKILQMAMKASTFCVQALNAEGPVDIWALVQAIAMQHQDLFNGGVSPWSQKLPQEWIYIVEHLTLTHEQIHTMMVCRQEYHDRMEILLQRRQEMNSKIVSHLLPNDLRQSSLDIKEFTGKVGDSTKVQKGQYNYKLDTLVQKLKNILQREQLYFAKMEEVVLFKLLSPLQVAWFMLESLPEHCDVLALVNAVYETYGKEISIEETAGSQCGFCDVEG
eukprot:TRINITY_DN2299_c0_g1_i15.p2 TRINITY_DN2299_c0_g1~~TRINITY_DN2299_c0_g1_i15.p2  ORF type:complete len:441 (-),score=56.34 TRINITY_DN2299_c0_g1_i15:119-1441(-)